MLELHHNSVIVRQYAVGLICSLIRIGGYRDLRSLNGNNGWKARENRTDWVRRWNSRDSGLLWVLELLERLGMLSDSGVCSNGCSDLLSRYLPILSHRNDWILLGSRLRYSSSLYVARMCVLLLVNNKSSICPREDISRELAFYTACLFSGAEEDALSWSAALLIQIEVHHIRVHLLFGVQCRVGLVCVGYAELGERNFASKEVCGNDVRARLAGIKV